MTKKINKYLLFSLIAVPIIIYIYFLRWKTDTMYGDDLLMFRDLGRLDTFIQKVNWHVAFQKYRPVHGVTMHLIIEWFQKNLDAYYVFNVAIQTLNTFIFALVLNLFLRSPLLALLFSLIFGLSRFAFFNISQLLNGGALEGLAMTFFLLSLYFMVKALVKNDLSDAQKQKAVLFAILYSTLSIYTHERYIVIFPCIILATLLAPSLKTLALKQRVVLSVLALASLLLNVAIKDYVFSMPFFVGTGGTNIAFSFSDAANYLLEAVLSIFQVNSGPEYLVGLKFSSLSLINKILAVTIMAGSLAILSLYLIQSVRRYASKEKQEQAGFFVFLFLGALFFALLVPAIVTIRLEHRWLQASLCVFVLMVIIALGSVRFKNLYTRNTVFALFVLVFLWLDFNYFYKGADNLYMKFSERTAASFHQAMSKGVIRPGTKKLYIWEKQRDVNNENAIFWSLGEGYLFDFYQNSSKKVVFVDSIYQKSYSFPVSSFVNFNAKAEQIVYIHSEVIDITDQYLQDSLKSYDDQNIDALVSAEKIQYNQDQLLITNDDFDKFTVDGFHNNENGIRWTNGNASIGFRGNYLAKDSLKVEMNTYLPEISKNIVPRIIISDKLNREHKPVQTGRNGDKFYYQFYFNELTKLEKIAILSDTINAAPDVRKLSFPFISLELRK